LLALVVLAQAAALFLADNLLHWLRDGPATSDRHTSAAWGLWGIQFARAALFLLAAGFWLRIVKSRLTKSWRRVVLIIAFLILVLLPEVPVLGTLLLIIVLLKIPWTADVHGWRRIVGLLGCIILLLLLLINIQGGGRDGESDGASWDFSFSPAENLFVGELTDSDASASQLSTPFNSVVRVVGRLLRLQLLIATFQLLVFPIRLRGLSLKRRFTVTTVLYRVIPGFLGFVVLVLGIYFGLGLHKTRLAQEAFNETLNQNLVAAKIILDTGANWPGKTATESVLVAFGDSHRWNTQRTSETYFVLKQVGLRFPEPDPGEIAVAEIDTIFRALGSDGTPEKFLRKDFYGAGAVDTVTGMITADTVLYLGAARARRSGDTAVVAEVYVPVDSLYLSRIAGLVNANVRVRVLPHLFIGESSVTYGGDDDSTVVDTSFTVAADLPVTGGGEGFWHESLYLAKSFIPLSDWGKDLAGGVAGAAELTLNVAPARLVGGIVSNTIAFTSNAIAILIFALILLLFLLAEYSAARTGRGIIRGILDDVKGLAEAATRFGEGNLGHRVEVRGKDELGSLRASFNTMAENIEENQELLLEKERLEADLALARDIQQRLLPQSSPVMPGLDMAGISIPSREVGGDLFYFLPVPEGRLGLTIGDVSGKSVPAALLMSNVLAALKTEARLVEDEHEILTHLNSLIAEQVEPGRFVTFFYGVVDRKKKRLKYACAGHNPSLKISANGSAEWLAEAGVPLGVLPENVYVPAETSLEVGDVIVLYSDGVTEAERPKDPSAAPTGSAPGETDKKKTDEDEETFEELEAEEEPDFFDEQRLENAVREARDRSASEIVQAVVDAVHEFTGGADLSDDLTLVVVKITD
jgi:serine phosphatase RsbU (regulator of sigma subunit)